MRGPAQVAEGGRPEVRLGHCDGWVEEEDRVRVSGKVSFLCGFGGNEVSAQLESKFTSMCGLRGIIWQLCRCDAEGKSERRKSRWKGK